MEEWKSEAMRLKITAQGNPKVERNPDFKEHSGIWAKSLSLSNKST